MFRKFLKSIKTTIFIVCTINCSIIFAESLDQTIQKAPPSPGIPPAIIPSAPTVNAKAYILIDAKTGKIISEKNSETRLPPASLTKVMTLYVVSKALANNQIHLEDLVRVSNNAWKIGGSRMFVKEGQMVPIEDLLKGIIVDSGNDACVAIAEHLGGSEEGFAEIMNGQAKSLGMVNSHFTDSTGLPNEQLYTTAQDLAILSRAIVNEFPQYYHWYKEKWFTFNGIRQPNRNRLLWRDSQVDGIKTGHTNDAGYCLISSAIRGDMRLIAVVLNSPSESTRADDSERLLNYGFRFYETRNLYKANQPITKIRLYKSNNKSINVGLLADDYVTVPTGQYNRLTVSSKVPEFLEAPVKKGQEVGELIVKFDDKIIAKKKLLALSDEESGGFYTRAVGAMQILFSRWFG